MSAVYALAIEGLTLDGTLDNIDPAIVRSARAAINTAAARGRTLAAVEIGHQVNFPSGYLNPAGGRLVVSRQATNDSLEAVISGRQRPTSLARFAVSTKLGKQAGDGVGVAVHPGSYRTVKRAFLIKLRAGSASLDTQFNLGLAVRTTGGQKPPGAYAPKQIAPDLWLLYGPSVAQVFKGQDTGARGARDVISPDVQNFLAAEFDRLIGAEIQL